MIDLKLGTIFGAQVGFEYVTRKDFESVGHPANWSILINLFAIRITITSWPEDDEE